MEVECDVLVVGAGPAGSSAARAAALNGTKTIFIDKKEEIGTPVKCAEGIGEYLFPYLPFKIPSEQLIWKMEGMYFQTDDISVERTGDLYKSYSVERKNFDKWVSKLAIEKGAELYKNTKLTALELDEENNVKKAVVKKKDKTFDIKPQIVIAADGSESTVLKLLGLYNPKEGDLAEVYSWEMKNLDLYKPKLEQVFTGEFTPSGYAYIFPKSKTTANIGVGGIFPERKMEKYFEEFLELPHVKKQVKNAEYVVEKSGKAVWNDLTDEWIYGNVLLTGDVANQNFKPFIEGILPAISCGDIAGNLSSMINSTKNNNYHLYRKSIQDLFEKDFKFSKKIEDIIWKLSSKKNFEINFQFFGIAAGLFALSEFKKIEKMNCNQLKTLLENKIKDKPHR